MNQKDAHGIFPNLILATFPNEYFLDEGQSGLIGIIRQNSQNKGILGTLVFLFNFS